LNESGAGGVRPYLRLLYFRIFTLSFCDTHQRTRNHTRHVGPPGPVSGTCLHPGPLLSRQLAGWWPIHADGDKGAWDEQQQGPPSMLAPPSCPGQRSSPPPPSTLPARSACAGSQSPGTLRRAPTKPPARGAGTGTGSAPSSGPPTAPGAGPPAVGQGGGERLGGGGGLVACHSGLAWQTTGRNVQLYMAAAATAAAVASLGAQAVMQALFQPAPWPRYNNSHAAGALPPPSLQSCSVPPPHGRAGGRRLGAADWGAPLARSCCCGPNGHSLAASQPERQQTAAIGSSRQPLDS
jgi:hypothetical protein